MVQSEPSHQVVSPKRTPGALKRRGGKPRKVDLSAPLEPGRVRCCDCGCESTLAEAFVRRPGPGKSLRMRCPGCLKKLHKGTSFLWCFAILFACAFVLAGTEGLLLAVIFGGLLIGSLVIHEVGHLTAALLVGLRARRLQIGVGTTWFSGRIGGLRIELKANPFFGLTLVTFPDSRWLPLRYFVMILGGPLANMVLAAGGAIAWRGGYGSPTVVMLTVTNALMAALNLWPRRAVALRYQLLRSDGAQLLQILRQPHDLIPLRRAGDAFLEGYEQLMAGNPGESVRHFRAALDIQPDDPILLQALAAALVANQQFEQARTICLDLIVREGLDPTVEACVWSNLAVANRHLQREELRDEGWWYAAAAFTRLPWEPSVKAAWAGALVEAGDLATGLELLDEAIIDEENRYFRACLHASAALAQWKAGNQEAYNHHFAEARKLHTGNTIVEWIERHRAELPLQAAPNDDRAMGICRR